MLEHITKYLSVSIVLPGPIRASHQPAEFSSGVESPAACAEPVNAWHTSITLSLLSLSVP